MTDPIEEPIPTPEPVALSETKALRDGIEYFLTVEEEAALLAQQAADQPAAAQLEAALLKRYDGIVQARIDAVARAFGYGDPNRPEVSPILHAITYADEPAVLRFQAEGQALRAWRSRTWAAAAAMLNAVQAGTRAVPTPEDLLAELEASAPAPTQAPL